MFLFTALLGVLLIYLSSLVGFSELRLRSSYYIMTGESNLSLLLAIIGYLCIFVCGRLPLLFSCDIMIFPYDNPYLGVLGCCPFFI